MVLSCYVKLWVSQVGSNDRNAMLSAPELSILLTQVKMVTLWRVDVW